MPLERVCYDCGSRTTTPVARCDCGEPLWLATDPSALSTFDWDAVTDAPGMWRYAPLLPVDGVPADDAGLLHAAGGTPLLRTPALDDFAGARVHVKVEGEHPTGSFKDRGSALGVAAVAAGHAGDVSAVGTVSHGNMAMSTAAFAAAADLPCLVLVPADVPEARLEVVAQFDPTVRRVAGDYGRLYERTLDVGPDHGVAFLNSDVPLRTAGQKTTTLEICEAFATGADTASSATASTPASAPDAIVFPVSSGGHASAAWKALRELRESGVLDAADVPSLYLVQAAACAPIAEAFEADAEDVTPVEEDETIAYSIANPDPPSGKRALAAARDTGGAVLAVDDDAIRTAQRELATEAGLSVEAASAVALAGLQELTTRGTVDASDDVAVVATGTGLKEATGATVEAPTVDLADVDDELAAFGDAK
ncbi:threonine synthase [Halospeciosus flavus]|uniref:Pyridoxal-phosphate dependent enzyme n=1 Tax=Halospeciosus flavus TaxID=3032283 RepID=A0ABD5Z271_9EURY|nr:pyridoxal-phosphate dependent enzyme [Halospeciosus flavus]